MTVKTSVEDKSSVIKDIKIEIPRSMFDGAVSAKSSSIAGRVQLKGFRKGKAPKNYVKKLYGSDLKQDVLNELVREHYKAVIDKENLNTVGLPDIDVKNLEDATADVQVIVTVSLMPDPEIKDYKGVKVEVEVQKVVVADIEAQLKQLQEQSATLKNVADRDVVAVGDVVTFDYKGSIDGKNLSDLSKEDVDIELIEGKAPEHLFNGLPGMKVGETKEISLEVPKDIQDKKFAGKNVVYKTTIKGIQEKVLPELSDEFAKNLASHKAETLVELKKEIETALTNELEEINKSARLNKILEKVAEKNMFEIPQKLIDEEIRTMLHEWGFFKGNEDRAAFADVSRFRDNLGKEAEKKVKNMIILDKIKKHEKISVSSEDIEAWFDEQAEKYKLEKERMKEYYESHGKDNLVQRIIENERAIDILISNAKIKEVEKEQNKNSNS